MLRFGTFGIPESLIILTIITLILGIGRIDKIAGELGKGIGEFRISLSVNVVKDKESVGKSTEG